MSGKEDQVKGGAKEVVGTVSGNKHLESEGKEDRQVVDVKQAFDHAKGKIEEFVDKAKDKGEETVRKFRDARS